MTARSRTSRGRKKAPSRKPDIILSWCMVMLYSDLIYSLSSMSRLPLPMPFGGKFYVDKLFHGVEYAILGVFLIRTFYLTWTFKTWRELMWLVLVVGGLYAASDEWHQSFVPNRIACVEDWGADMTGLWVGAAVWRRRKKNYLKKIKVKHA